MIRYIILILCWVFFSQYAFAKGDVAANLTDLKSRPLLIVKLDVNSTEFLKFMPKTKGEDLEKKIHLYNRIALCLDSALRKNWTFTTEFKTIDEADFLKMNDTEKSKWTAAVLSPFNIGGDLNYSKLPGFLSLAVDFERAEKVESMKKAFFTTFDYIYPLPFASDYEGGISNNEMACFIKMVQLGIDENIKADKNLSFLQFAEAQTKKNCVMLDGAIIYMADRYKHEKANDEKYAAISQLKIVSASDFDTKVGNPGDNEYVFMGFQIDGNESFLITGQYVVNPKTGQILNCFRENGLCPWPGRIEKSFECP
jgi:hypothetical protein